MRCTSRASLNRQGAGTVECMDNRAEVREFLTTRRAKLTPADVGLPDVGQRRVPGLRRGEVAALAGVSIEYYSKLERGAIAGAIVFGPRGDRPALRLDDTERAHLFDLARAADGIPTSGRRRRTSSAMTTSRPSLGWLLESITEGIAFVRNPQQDLLATNALGRAFYTPLIGAGGRTPNLARFQFLDPASRDFYPDWDLFAHMCVVHHARRGRPGPAQPRHAGPGRRAVHPERHLPPTAGVPTTCAPMATGTKRFNHPDVGEVEFAYEELALTAEPGLAMIVYTAEPGSPTAEKVAPPRLTGRRPIRRRRATSTEGIDR